MLHCRPAADVAANIAPAVAVAGANNGDVSEEDQNFDATGCHIDVTQTVNCTEAAAAVPRPHFNIDQLLQRPKKPDQKHIVLPVGTESLTTCNTGNTYKLHETQTAYEEYCEVIRGSYSDEFWRVFATVYREPAVTIDRVLKGCKDVFVVGKEMRKRFEVYGCPYMVVHI